MEKTGVNKLKKIWESGTVQEGWSSRTSLAEQSIYDAMGHIFCPGPFYFYVFDFGKMEFVYLHPGIEQVLGIRPENVSFSTIGSLIPEADLLHLQRCEALAMRFLFDFLEPHQIDQYKVSYCYHIRGKNGDLVLILHQAIALTLDEHNRIARTLGVHTDISHLVDQPNRKVSFIGINGAPSYLGIDPQQESFESPKLLTPALTPRELEILRYLSEGDTVPEISDKLFLSAHTVRTHRNNLRKKLNCKNTAQVIAVAIRQGLI